jgi:pimeloyl-ACP methyl ester carboxylesterase
LKRWHKLYKIISIVLGVVLVLYLGISWYGAKTAMEIPRLPVVYDPAALGTSYENVAFPSRGDNLTLTGWFLPGVNKDVILVVNGGFQNRIDDNSDTGGLARALAAEGHNILLYDLRGRGESEGKGRSLLHIDEDIGGAVDYLVGRGFATDAICILGFCSGAASAAMYAGGNGVGSLILVGCFIDMHTMVIRQAQSINAPTFLAYLFWPGGIVFTRLFYGYHVVNPIDVMPGIACPVLFVHEELDDFSSSAETQRLYHAAPNPANEVWEVPGAVHSQVFRVRPAEFVAKIGEFIDRTIGLSAD